IPLYVRAGAVLPMGPVKQYTDERVDAPLTLAVHPGMNGSFSLYEDDGKSFNFRKGEFMRMNIAWDDVARRLTLRLGAGSKMLPPAKRNIVARLVGTNQTREILFDGRPAQVHF